MAHASSSLFQVYLRLKPSHPASVGPAAQLDQPVNDRFLAVEQPDIDGRHGHPTHITVIPPTDSRRRAVEKFAFTRVFEEEATQLDVFDGTEVVSLIEGVLAPNSRHGRDGLVATLGVTGSGKVG